MNKMTGVVLLNKPKGYTSQDAIRVVKGITKAEKVGHTGTLDPEATGVLPVCLGKATKIAELIAGSDKTYEAELTFGAVTDTQDASGQVLETFDYTFDEAKVRQTVLSFLGEIDQLPPMYSAIKIHGQKLYDLARRGIEVERKPRKVRIDSLEVLSLTETTMRIRVHCSKGTYIRTLCEDIGRALGYGAYMSSLTRTACGPYTLADSFTLEELEACMQEGTPEVFLRDLKALFAEVPVVTVPKEDVRYLLSGNYLTYPVAAVPGNIGDLVRMETETGELMALYRIREEKIVSGIACKRLTAEKMFV